MDNYRADHSHDPFTPTATSAKTAAAEKHDSGGVVSLPLPAGWQRLATGLRGTWLYQINLSGGGAVHWVAEMMLNGKVLKRRFAAELHARAWLTIVCEPRSSTIPFDLEEFNEAFRAAALLRRG
jgi:hypothetical protein